MFMERSLQKTDILQNITAHSSMAYGTGGKQNPYYFGLSGDSSSEVILRELCVCVYCNVIWWERCPVRNTVR